MNTLFKYRWEILTTICIVLLSQFMFSIFSVLLAWKHVKYASDKMVQIGGFDLAAPIIATSIFVIFVLGAIKYR